MGALGFAWVLHDACHAACRGSAPFRGGRLPRNRRNGTIERHYPAAAAHCAGAVALLVLSSCLGPSRPHLMTFAVVHSRALRGLESPAVTVEVHLANGLPSFTLVGLADTEVKESRERVRAALQTSGLEFPHNKRVTVSLAPADLPKESGRFDLPIALGILAAAGQIDAARLDGYEFAGELSLGGQLRPVHGALAMALA